MSCSTQLKVKRLISLSLEKNQKLILVKTLKRFLIFLLLTNCVLAGYSQSLRNEWIDYSKTYYKFKLNTTGIYRITQAQLNTLGIGGVPASQYKLWRNGVEVPLYTASLAGNGYIEFFGEQNDGKPDTDLYLNASYQQRDDRSLETDWATYFLTVSAGANARLEPVTTDLSNPGTALPYFNYKKEVLFGDQLAKGRAAYISSFYIYSSSYDVGEGFRSNATDNYNADLSALKVYKADQNLKMDFSLAASGSFVGKRNIVTSLKDSLVAAQDVFDYNAYTNTVQNLSTSVVENDHVNLKITSTGGSFFIAKYSLTYPRLFDFDNQTNFRFDLPANGAGNYLEISNFNHSGGTPVLYDISNGKQYAGVVEDNVVKIKMAPTAVLSHCVLFNNNTTMGVGNFTTRTFVNYASANVGDYLIIANKILNTGAGSQVEAYKTYRTSADGGGYNAKIYDIDEITDQFGYGINKHPIAIRNFLRYTRANFPVEPKFVILIGRGVDYHDFYGKEDATNAETLNQIPTWGHPASDILLSADNNSFPSPKTPIGRIGVINTKELQDYLVKVKEYEFLQKHPEATQAGDKWRKDVLHIIGASDASTGAILTPLMANYGRTLSDTSYGASVHTYIKANNPNLSQATAEVTNYINNGVSLITYFGHSSATNLDFNLTTPASYSNSNGKYPVFIANGCDAGNFYIYDDGRVNNNLSLSEKFLLAPKRGMIAFLANTHYGIVNTLDYMTSAFYKATSVTDYGKSIGEIQKKAMDVTWPIYSGDYLTRLTLEQFAINGDPAIRFMSNTKPDYSVETQNITINPSFVSSSNTGFNVNALFYNLGKAVSDSVEIKVQRQVPDGSITNIGTYKVQGIRFTDSLSVNIPIVGYKEKGTNQVIITIDPENKIDELSKVNNTVTKSFEISDDEIVPVYPYSYSILTKPELKLFGSTTDPLEPSRTYRVQVDTTELFNSSAIVAQDVTSVGGVIEFNPTVAMTDGRVYYWRIAPVVNGTPVNWRTASFLYNPSGSNGWNQSHVYQHLKSSYNQISLDSISRKLSYTGRTSNLFIVHSKYPESGLQDNDFSVTYNGTTGIASACVGYSIIFNVFDTINFKPWKNVPGGYGGSAPFCGNAGREYNFEFQYLTVPQRKNIMDFISDSIPNGYYVVARVILAANGNGYADSYANAWKADTALPGYGPGKSLYHSLYNQGAVDLDSINQPRIWAFVFKKNAAAQFTPQFRFSQNLYDRITESIDCPTINIAGTVTSPKFGPAKQWKDLKWRGHSVETSNSQDSISLKVIGVRKDGTETVLETLDKTQFDHDVSSVNAAEYPFIKLSLYNQDDKNTTPWQLDSWRLNYTPVPEGALAPNLYYSATDSSEYNTITQSSKIKMGIAFKNVSDNGFDSIKVKVKLINSDGKESVVFLPKLKPINTNDTANVYFELNADTLSGTYTMMLDVNPDDDQPEQFHINNFLYKSVVIYRPDNSGICPGLDKVFTADNTAPGNSYVWQVNSGSGWTTVNNSALYSGATTATLKLTKPQTSLYGNKYRALITNGGNTTTGAEHALKFSATWTGAVDTAWENKANWGCGVVPDQFTDVYVNDKCPHYPTVSVNTACRSLRIMPNTTVNVKAGIILDITGKITN